MKGLQPLLPDSKGNISKNIFQLDKSYTKLEMRKEKKHC